jgi:hypothetical protein
MNDRTHVDITNLIRTIQSGTYRRLPAKYYCLDCEKPAESYMLNRDVWLAAMKPDEGLCCISCFEKRLGRDLHYTDFRPSPNNLAIFRGMLMGA